MLPLPHTCMYTCTCPHTHITHTFCTCTQNTHSHTYITHAHVRTYAFTLTPHAQNSFTQILPTMVIHKLTKLFKSVGKSKPLMSYCDLSDWMDILKCSTLVNITITHKECYKIIVINWRFHRWFYCIVYFILENKKRTQLHTNYSGI